MPLRFASMASSLVILTCVCPSPGPRLSECECASGQSPEQQQGAPAAAAEMARVHDPAIAKEAGTYYVYSTGRGISVITSRDLHSWRRSGPVFEQPVPWSASAIPGSTDYYWAPDIAKFGGRWRLYYSVSTFGSNRSAIGLATNVTLDSSRADYSWKDEGIVLESHRSDDWNAIDPNVFVDAIGQPWLTFGSFWSGIKLIQLDRSTGKPAQSNATIHALAARSRSGDIKGSVEAPFMVRHGGFYYLFVSFDFCCRGVNSTYNVRVGRAKEITGPYVDREGAAMLDGGGTRVVWGEGRWRGPGHNAILHDGRTDWLVYHAYDAEDRGIPKLRIEKMRWSPDGWPQAPSMAAPP